MGRPPNAPSHSPTRPWVPPFHMAGGLLRGTLTPHANKVRQFVLDIPPVPIDTAKAIRESLAGSTVQPFAAQQNRIRALHAKVLDQRAKAAASQKRILELEDKKEQGLRDIRETRQQETADIVAVVERKLRSRYNKESVAAHDLWKEHLEEECEAKRQAWRQQQQQDNPGTGSNSQEGGEPDKKRVKLEEDESQQDRETPSTAVDAPNPESLVATVDDTATATTIGSDVTVDTDTKKSDALRKQLLETEAALEKLTETRAELIWLLKQVIKADEKLSRTSSSTAAAATVPKR